MEHFGKFIRAYRDKYGLSLEDLADRLGTTRQALSKYERQERSPKFSDVYRWAEILGVTLTGIANGVVEYKQARACLQIEVDQEELRFLEAYRRADADIKGIAYEVLTMRDRNKGGNDDGKER